MQHNGTVSMLTSFYKSKQSPTNSIDLDYPSSWSIDDVTKWLHDISLENYCESFRSKI